MRLMHIVGARPQFIKMASVSRAVAAHNSQGTQGARNEQPPTQADGVSRAIVNTAPQGAGNQPLQGIEELSIHTGQHYDDNMSTVFFEELQIPKPNYNLGVGFASRRHSQVATGEGE